MGAVIAGIVLIIVAVVLWTGHITVDHALALLIGITGALILLGGFVPSHYIRRP